MPRDPKQCPKLVGITRTSFGYEALILCPTDDPTVRGEMKSVSATSAVGAITGALVVHPALLNVGHFTENKQA